MSPIPSQFAVWKRSIGETLSKELSRRADAYRHVHTLGPDVLDRLKAFSIAGKMIRGGLVCLGSVLARGQVDDSVLSAATAVELFQSALLVHDDIMDRDRRRRGSDSVYHQYEQMADSDRIGASLHIGESLGMCAGDIAFFVAFELLATLDVPEGARREIAALGSRELQYVGIAQMADVYRGAVPDLSALEQAGTSSDAALKVYLYKTGRYTFSMPLMIGVLLAGGPEPLVNQVEKLGEHMGVLFQIKDDEIGLYGDPSITGKPVGSDIVEGKKTIYYTELIDRIDGTERKRLDRVFGNPDAKPDEIAWVTDLIESSGTRGSVDARLNTYVQSAAESIDALQEVSETGISVLQELLAFSTERER